MGDRRLGGRLLKRAQQEHSLPRLRRAVVRCSSNHCSSEVACGLRVRAQRFEDVLVARMKNARDVLKYERRRIGLEDETQELMDQRAPTVRTGSGRLLGPVRGLSASSCASVRSLFTLVDPVSRLAERLTRRAPDNDYILARAQPCVRSKLTTGQGRHVSDHRASGVKCRILRHRLARIGVVVDGESQISAGALRAYAKAARTCEKIDHRKLFDHGIPFVLTGENAVTVRGSSDIARQPHPSVPSVAARARERRQRVDDESR